MKLDELLDSRDVHFERLHHPTVFTAKRMAGVLHVPRREVAKSVLLRTEDRYALAVLPANRRVDMDRIRACLEVDEVELAAEAELDQVFPDCERGAMPPFGSLYNLETVVDESLADDTEIVFEAHNHQQAIRMTFRDYAAIEHPRLGRFAFKT